MGFPMTAKRVIERNRLDQPDAMGEVRVVLLDDIRRMEADSATLAVRAYAARLREAVDGLLAIKAVGSVTFDRHMVAQEEVLRLIEREKPALSDGGES